MLLTYAISISTTLRDLHPSQEMVAECGHQLLEGVCTPPSTLQIFLLMRRRSGRRIPTAAWRMGEWGGGHPRWSRWHDADAHEWYPISGWQGRLNVLSCKRICEHDLREDAFFHCVMLCFTKRWPMRTEFLSPGLKSIEKPVLVSSAKLCQPFPQPQGHLADHFGVSQWCALRIEDVGCSG